MDYIELPAETYGNFMGVAKVNQAYTLHFMFTPGEILVVQILAEVKPRRSIKTLTQSL